MRGQWAIGTVPGEDRVVLPVRWNLATGEVTRVPYGGAGGVTAAGDVLAADGSPLLWAADGTVRRLPGLADVAAADPGTYQASAVSGDGRTVVGSVHADGRHRPVVWRC